MRDDEPIHLTHAEHARVTAYALERGLTKEAAAHELASQRITDLFAVKPRRGHVTPLRGLKGDKR